MFILYLNDRLLHATRHRGGLKNLFLDRLMTTVIFYLVAVFLEPCKNLKRCMIN